MQLFLLVLILLQAIGPMQLVMEQLSVTKGSYYGINVKKLFISILANCHIGIVIISTNTKTRWQAQLFLQKNK